MQLAEQAPCPSATAPPRGDFQADGTRQWYQTGTGGRELDNGTGLELGEAELRACGLEGAQEAVDGGAGGRCGASRSLQARGSQTLQPRPPDLRTPLSSHTSPRAPF